VRKQMSGDTDEWFDVVDERDHVIGRQRRKDVHRLGLRHRAVHVFVRRSDGRLLIHKRSALKEEFPGVWTSSASGHVSAGEAYAAAAHRELTEELGITAELQRCCRFHACTATSMEFTELFECRWDGELSPDPHEIQAIDWVDTQELPDQIRDTPEHYSPVFRLLFGWYDQQSR